QKSEVRGQRSEVSTDVRAIRLVAVAELLREILFLRQHRDEVHGQQRGNREHRDPEIVDRHAEAELDKRDADVHRVSREAAGSSHDERGRRLPGNRALPGTREMNARRGDETHTGDQEEQAAARAERPSYRYRRTRHSELTRDT